LLQKDLTSRHIFGTGAWAGKILGGAVNILG